MCTVAGAPAVFPAQALLFNTRAGRLMTYIFTRIGSTVGFAEGMAARNQRYGFFVIHRHTAKSFTDITCRSHRVRVAIRAFRIYIDQTHLHGSQRIFQLTVAFVAFVAQPFLLVAPVYILGSFPNILTSSGEAESFKTH